jgi:hypothetical protein
MNTSITRVSLKLAAAAAVSAVALAAFASPVPAGSSATAAQWQEHKGSIDYFGLTSTYSCTGMESKVKQILLALGARKDIRVDASTCAGHDMPMGHAMTVSIRMFSLAPVDPAATVQGAAPPIMASWSAVEINAQRPMFMGDGDCELIDHMRDFITKNFSAQNVDYRASCTPHETSINSFAIHGEFLKNTST